MSGQQTRRRIRLKDVAQEAGVSVITAWRVLNKPELVSSATIDAVQRTIDRIGYVPDTVARSLLSSHSRVIGAIVPTVANSVFSETIQGVANELHAHGYEFLLGCSNYDRQIEEQVIRAMLGRRTDGLIVTGRSHSATARRLLEGSEVPIVEVWDNRPGQVDMSVGFSNTRLAAEVTRYLAGKGHRHIGFVNVAGRERGLARIKGYRAELKRLGLPAPDDYITEADDSLDGGKKGLQRLLLVRPKVSAIFFNGDTLAVGALLECQRLGIPVPRQMAIVGHGDLEIGAHVIPALTTVRIHGETIGQKAAQLLMQRIKVGSANKRRIDVGIEIVERESV